MSVTNITVDFINQVDNIDVSFESGIDNITVDVQSQIENITLDFGYRAQNIYSVNDLLGVVQLTASATLGSVSSSAGIYSYTFTHNLGYLFPIVSIYSTDNEMVFSDIILVDTNNLIIKSSVDLEGYKVVAQR